EGFEPSNGLPRCWFSRPVQSATLPPLRPCSPRPYVIRLFVLPRLGPLCTGFPLTSGYSMRWSGTTAPSAVGEPAQRLPLRLGVVLRVDSHGPVEREGGLWWPRGRGLAASGGPARPIPCRSYS